MPANIEYVLDPSRTGGDRVRIPVPNEDAATEAVLQIYGQAGLSVIAVAGSMRFGQNGPLILHTAPTVSTTNWSISAGMGLFANPASSSQFPFGDPGAFAGGAFALPAGMSVAANMWAVVGVYVKPDGSFETDVPRDTAMQPVLTQAYGSNTAALTAGTTIPLIGPTGGVLIGRGVFQNGGSTFTAGVTTAIAPSTWSPMSAIDAPIRGTNALGTATAAWVNAGYDAVPAGAAGNGIWRFPVAGLKWLSIRAHSGTSGSPAQSALIGDDRTVKVRVSFVTR